MNPTHEYNTFEQAYDFFNETLFGGELPSCMITLNRKRGAGGYFWPNKFVDRALENVTDEIALNSDEFHQFDDRFILSILVHEMAHLWQQHFGKPSRNGYHNTQWVLKMQSIGLDPFNVDNPTKKTGQRINHNVIDGGPYDTAWGELVASGFALTWQSVPESVTVKDGKVVAGSEEDGEESPKKRSSKTKYTCPGCQANAWAKPDSNLVCGDCEMRMEAAA